jgi:hypothetical protein
MNKFDESDKEVGINKRMLVITHWEEIGEMGGC